MPAPSVNRLARRPGIPAVLVLLLALSLAGCKGKEPSSDLPTATMPIGNRTFTLEVAAGGASRNRGLMFRDSMPADHGMVFCFAAEEERFFYMRNTRIPLDILYLDRNGRVVSIKQMQPYVEDSVPSGSPARYAIELNQGTAAAVGVRAGDVLQLPTPITSAAADP